MYKISIVIPVYNVGEYIERGIKSLINQENFSDLELIFINDGTKDNSVEIIDKYRKKYSNIILLNKINGGVSSARNLGLEHVTSKYVCFLDPDDEVEPDYYKQLYNLIVNTNYDIVSTNYQCKFSNGKTQIKKERFKESVSGSTNALKLFLSGGIIGNNLFDKIFWSNQAKKIKFDTTKRIGEDMDYVYNYLKNANYLLVDTTCNGYIYYKNDNSAMNSNFSEKFFDSLELSKKYTKEFENNKELYDYCYAHEMHERCKLLEYMLLNNGRKDYNDKWKENKRILKKVKYSIIIKRLNKRQFLGIVLMNVSPKAYMFFLKLLKIN